MNRGTSVWVGVLLLAVVSASRAAEPVSFKSDIVPLLKTRCAVCHLTGEEAGNMALHPRAAYATLVGVPSVESPLLRIEPKSPDESYLVRKLEGTQIAAGGKGARMPLEGGPLSAEEIARIRNWISAGALDN